MVTLTGTGVAVGVGIGVTVGTGVGDGTGVAVGVGNGVMVGTGVGDGAGIAVGVGTGTAVGVGVFGIVVLGATLFLLKSPTPQQSAAPTPKQQPRDPKAPSPSELRQQMELESTLRSVARLEEAGKVAAALDSLEELLGRHPEASFRQAKPE